MQCPRSQSQPWRGHSAAELPEAMAVPVPAPSERIPWDGMLHHLNSLHLKGQGDESQSPRHGEQCFSGGPKASILHKHSNSPIPLCYPQLWEAACTQCDHSLSSPRAPIWTWGQPHGSQPRFLLPQAKHTPHQTSTEKPELKYIPLGEGSTGNCASPHWLGKRDWKGNLC